MKQSELDKLLNAELKALAKKHRWKFSRGFVFKATDRLFFRLIVAGNAKSRNLHTLFQYKWLEFDDLFWKIVLLEENAKQPLSFRAYGAWTAPMATILTSNQQVDEWDVTVLRTIIDKIFQGCDEVADQYTSEIQTVEDNLRVIERLDSERRQNYPNARFDIGTEIVLSAILQGDHEKALKTIDDRCSKNDAGGFMVGTAGFFDLASDYVRALKR